MLCSFVGWTLPTKSSAGGRCPLYYPRILFRVHVFSLTLAAGAELHDVRTKVEPTRSMRVWLAMTQYLPHCSKKLLILQRREAALFKLIRDGAAQKKIMDAAHQVRLARIRAIEAQIAANGPRAEPNIHDEHIATVKNLSVETILAYFGYSPFAESGPASE